MKKKTTKNRKRKNEEKNKQTNKPAASFEISTMRSLIYL